MDKIENGFCGDEFWNFDIFWNSERPRLTGCFKNSVLVLLPCGYLWLDLLFSRLKPRVEQSTLIKSPPFTVLGVTKWVLTAILVLCSSVELVYLTYVGESGFAVVPYVNYVSAVVRIFTFVLALFLQVKQKRDGKMNSYSLSIFWFLLFICGVFSSPVFDLMSDSIDHNSDSWTFAVGSITFFIILAQMELSMFTDPQYSRFWDSSQDEYLIDHQPLIARMLFSWVNRLLSYGYRSLIGVNDLDQMNPQMQVRTAHRQFKEHWSKEEQKHKCSPQLQIERPNKEVGKNNLDMGSLLFKTLFRVLWPRILVAGILDLIYNVLSLLAPLVLDLIIQFMDSGDPMWHGYVYAALIFVCSAVSTVSQVHNLNYLIVTSLVPRAGLPAALYRKVLQLSSGARRRYTLGELCNLVSVDVQMIVSLVWDINTVWSAPLRIILTVALLWQYLGIACLSGVAVILFIIPLTVYLTRLTHKIQEAQMKQKDSRLRQMNEILNGIRVLKLFAWEYPFMEQVKDIRRKEVVTLRKLAFLNATTAFVWMFSPFLVAISSFVTFVLMDDKNILDPSIAFVSLTLFNNLRMAMAYMPQVIAGIVKARIAARRLTAFLLSEELRPFSVESPTDPDKALELASASFSWTNGEAPFLRDVTVSVNRGSLLAVVGQVGAGKSALLSAILGEMHRVQGTVRVKLGDKIAYVAQQAWIQNATLRQNVIFTAAMDNQRYNDTLDRCCLRADLEMLPGGDLTEIGEKGVNLSGGQKQRVSVARALYQDADIYLFDDPLSAVDSHVGAHIFKHVIGPEGALQGKTRILVTHDFSVLPDTDHILLLCDGKIQEMGSYQELMDQKGEFAKFVEEHIKKLKSSDPEDEASLSEEPQVESPNVEQLSTEELKEQMRRQASRLSRTTSTAEKKPKKKALVEGEKMEIGRVKGSVFLTYFKNATVSLTTIVFLGFAAYECFEIGSSVWLGLWSTDQLLADGSQDFPLRNLRIGVYGLLGLGQGASTLLAALVLAVAATRASINFHKSMLWSVMRSPMEFFDVTPIGRIINRFGKDINIVDINVPSVVNNILTVSVGVIGIIAVIAFTNPIFVLMLIPLGGVYIFYQLFYMATARQLQRLMSVTLSPVFSLFSETVQGASTIRAFAAQDRFTGKEDSLLQDNNRVFYTNSLVNRCVGIRLQLLGSVVIFIAAMLSVSQRGFFSSAVVGFSLSYALNITELLMKLLRHFTQLETHMISVERIDEYSKLTQEASWDKSCTRMPLEDWPVEGAVSFQDYKMRYRAGMDLILKGVTVDIAGGEKVGVVGRTGAGKSSFALSLFRVVEGDSGSILIDGVDIAILGLHQLRSKLTVIPQDPVLFSGSLRLNLDPFNEYEDIELWRAVEHSHLKSFIGGLDGGLDYLVAEGGENLSVGQRQQLCLARALLKKTRILVLDEATAAVDMETDGLIQSTIRTKFKDCTVITIAHRLYTILDYDRVLVMDNGKIAEQGAPSDLVRDTNSMFFELCRAAGLL